MQAALKITTAQTDANNHAVIITDGAGTERLFFKHYTLHAAQAASDNLRRDIARHGAEAVDPSTLPLAQRRITRKGKSIIID